ncbi:NADH-quinone oxidoreductase subunit J [candidate division KSB1 bacterium]|nr:NADH-quinone oxidoreductase subunit J [candidate division KSB1 bacterium]
MQEILFYLFALIAVTAGVAMVLHRNAVYSAIFLIVTLFAFAGFFVLLNAPFVAAVHIIVYAGAIMVLFLFVIMLLNLKRDPARERGKMTRRTLGVVLVLAFMVEIGALIIAATGKTGANGNVPHANSLVGSTSVIGKSLFTTYLFPFEVASILLLVGMIGAIILAKRKLE